MTRSKYLLLILSLTIILSLISVSLGACAAKPTPTPAPTAAPAPVKPAPTTAPGAPAPTAAPAATAPTAAPAKPAAPAATAVPTPVAKPAGAKVYEINLNTLISPTSPQHLGQFIPYKEEVEKNSSGQIKITLFPGAALGKSAAVYDLTRKGSIDISQFLPIYSPGVFPLSDVISLPFAIPTANIGTKVTMQLLEQKFLDPLLYNEIKTWMGATSSYQVFMAKRAVRRLEDMRGTKLRVPGGLLDDALKLMNVAPVSLPSGEMQVGMERGVVEGGVVSLAAAVAYKLEDVTKYVTIVNMGVVPAGIIMNRDKYNSLPPDLQKVIDKAGDNFCWNQAKVYDGEDDNALALYKSRGIQVIVIDPAERARWMQATVPVYDTWMADLEKKGLPIQKVYQEFKALLKAQGVELPR